jgi:hypothetical protein
MLDQISALPDELGQAETLLADSGYFSEANVEEACAAAGIEPLIPQGRQTHYPPLSAYVCTSATRSRESNAA